MAKAVIMAGGQGERFWPLTHPGFPKYRIRFEGKRSLLQNTFLRLAKIYGRGNIYVVTTRPHVRLIREELPSLKSSQIIIEPFRNNTCAAIYLACSKLRERFGDSEKVSFFPADQLIKNEKRFSRTLKGALKASADMPVMATIGIQPTFPATGYGYIEKGASVHGHRSVFRVKRFVEKPDRKKAQKYLKAGKFYWNAGMFTWKLATFFDAMKKHCPDFVRVFRLNHLNESYRKLPNLSIDYALMEKAPNIVVCSTTMDWCDMGSWDMLFEKSPQDAEKVYAEGLYYHREVRNSLIVNQTDRPLVVLDIDGIVAVQTPRGTLICRKGRSEEAALLAKKL